MQRNTFGTFWFIVLLSFFSVPCHAISSATLDSLKHALEEVEDDTIRIDILSDISYELVYHNPDTAILLSQKALELSEKIGNRSFMGSSLIDIGVAWWVKGDYDEAIDYYRQAESIFGQLGDTVEIIGAWVNLGIAFRGKGDYPRALAYYLQSLPQIELLGNKARLSSLCTNIGVLYRSMLDYDNAMIYYNRSKKLDEESGYKRGLVRSLHNIAHVYGSQNREEKAIEMYLESIELSREVGYTAAEATSRYNLGVLYTSRDEYFKALKSLQTALLLYRKLGGKDGEAGVLVAICDANLRMPVDSMQNKALVIGYDSLLSYALMAEKISEKSGNSERLYSSKKMLSRIYERNGNHKLSLDYYKQYAAVKDSMFNEDKSKEIGKLEAQHEFETEEADRKRTEEEQIKKEAVENSRRDNLQYSGILIFLVLIFAGVFMLGKFSIPVRLAEGMIFFSFLLFFEFSLVLLDPYIEEYSSGAPAIKLGFNAILAALIFPLHSLFESRLKGQLIKKS